MAIPTKYTYSISNDFIGLTEPELSTTALTNEIRESSISIALDYINTSSDDCDIWFKDELETVDQTTLSGVIALHTGELPEEESITTISGVVDLNVEKDSNNHLVIAPTHGYYEEVAHFKGFHITGSGIDVDTVEDYLIQNEIYVHGGWIWSNGGIDGDYIELSVVDKDDVMGLFSMFGLVSGVDVLELSKYVETSYIDPNGIPFTHIQSPTVAQVAQGLYMRSKVHTTSNATLNLGVTYLWFEG